MTKSGLFIPRTLLSRLRELTSQAKRPAPGPTLAGAGANSDATVIKCGDSHRASLGANNDATVIKCGDSPQASLGVICACVVQKYAGEELTLIFV